MVQKKFDELNLNNAFLFAAALEDEETCQLILELILRKPIPKVKVHVEHTLLYASEYKSVRLDVYARDEVQVGYNLEMQNKDEHNLPKRSRFHQAEIDVAALNPGDDFSDLKPSYIIFICTFDPFGYGLYRYTFEKMCLEADFPLGDETCTVFLNTKGIHEEKVPKELVNFLRYVENGSDADVCAMQDNEIEKLHEKICMLKKSRRWRGSYMTLGEYIEDEVAACIEERFKEYVEEHAEKRIGEYVEEHAEERIGEYVEKHAEERIGEYVEEHAEERIEKYIEEHAEERIGEYVEEHAEKRIEKYIEEHAEERIEERIEKRVKEKLEQARQGLKKEMRDKVEKEVREEAQKESEVKTLNLITAMMEAGETDLIPRLKEDETFLQEMYEKYYIV